MATLKRLNSIRNLTNANGHNMSDRTRQSVLSLTAICAASICLAIASFARGQELVMEGMEPTCVDHGVAPVTDFGSASFYSQDLGTILRLRYNTESYGQNDHGNFDIGTMQVLSFDESILFFDGQVTMNDVQGVGFNVGTGFRWMSYPPYALDGRIEGVSIWADGTSTEAGNFYPQLGVSYESLGELWDLRINSYTPLGPQDKIGQFVPTGETGFQGNSLSQLTEAVVDSSFYLAELEVARRLGPERDAWAFAGPYFLANDDDDSAGYRVGLRGYAYPDLLLQIALSDDEIFDTHATFSVTWFVGRTRTDFQPACGVADRMREPVMRNDYVVLAQSTETGGIPLTQPDGSALRFVHVDSMAAAGGDGTFENPFDMLSDVNGAGSQSSDIILAHAQSVFNGDTSAILKDDQRLLGEGDGMEFFVATAEDGTILIPETAPGARNAARPMIVAAIGDAIVMADGNEVANFDIDGQNTTSRAIFGMNLETAAFVHDLDIRDIAGNGIELDTVDEDVTFADISVTNGSGFGISLANVDTTSAMTLNNYTYDGGAGPAGGIRMNNFDGTFIASNSSLTNGTMAGVSILGDTDSSNITFQNTVTFMSIDGTAFEIDGDTNAENEFGATLIVNSDITNDTGGSVSVQGVGAGSATFNGDITDTGDGIRANSNGGGLTLFTGNIDLDTETSDAIQLTDNTGADIDFTGQIDITTTSGNGFVATGGGNLTVSNTGNTITTATGRVAQINNMTIDAVGANFSEVNRTAAANTSAIEVISNTGGPITFGDVSDPNPGDSGTLNGGAADTVVIENSANTTISAVRINNAANQSGIRVTKTTTDEMTVNVNDVEINDGDRGIEVAGGGTTGDLDMTINDTDVLDSTAFGLEFLNVDNGTIAVNGTTVDGNNANAAAVGVNIQNSDATFTFDSATEIREFGTTEFNVDGGNGNITYNGDIVNSSSTNPGDTTGRAVAIRNRTGGNVTFSTTSNITDDNEGIIVQNNNSGTVSFQGTNDLDTGTNNALTVVGNSGGTYSFNNFDINTSSGIGVDINSNGASANINFNGLDIVATTSGQAFRAIGPGTLTVSGSNTISSNTGVGLEIEDMSIGLASFDSIDVTNSSTNAVRLVNLTGTGLVLVGNAAGAANSGGTLSSTNEAIILQNVANAEFNNVQIASAGNNAVLIEHTATATTTMDVTFDGLNLDSTTGTGMTVNGANDDNAFNVILMDGDYENNVDMNITGASSFGLLVDNTDINETGADIGFALDFSGGATDGDVTIRDNSNFVADSAQALFIDSLGGTFKDIKILVADSSFITNGAPAAAQIESRGNTLMQTTVQGNGFDSAGAALYDLEIRSNGTNTARMRLNLGGDDPSEFNSANGAGRMQVEEAGTSNFAIFERDDTITADTRNNEPVDAAPNDAAFDNLATPPQLPTVP